MAENGKESTNGSTPQTVLFKSEVYELSPAQSRAVAALFVAPTLRHAARCAEVSERTLHRWIAEDDLFRKAVTDAQAGIIAEAAHRTAQLTSAAVDVIFDILNDKHAKPSDKMKAADMALSWSLKFQDAQSAMLERSRDAATWSGGLFSDDSDPFHTTPPKPHRAIDNPEEPNTNGTKKRAAVSTR